MVLKYKELQRQVDEMERKKREYQKRQRERKLAQDEYYEMEMWLYDPDIENAGDRV